MHSQDVCTGVTEATGALGPGRLAGVRLVTQSRTSYVAFGKSLGAFNTWSPHRNYGHKTTYQEGVWGDTEAL